MVDSIAVGLPILEIPFPASILEIYLSCTLTFISHIITLIFNPVSFVDTDVFLIDFFLSLRNLRLSVLGSIAMKEALLEFSLIPQSLIFEVKLAPAFHFACMPVADVELPIDVLV